MAEAIILVGNIGSGKTSLAKVLASKYVIICRDSLRYSIGAGRYVFNPTYEPAIVDTALYMFERFLMVGEDILLDEVNVSKEYRKKYIERAKRYNYLLTAIILPKLTMDESVNRRMKNPHDQADREIWEGVWTKFNAKYEEPTEEEGFSKIIKL